MTRLQDAVHEARVTQVVQTAQTNQPGLLVLHASRDIRQRLLSLPEAADFAQLQTIETRK
jgi:hypothetical protein